MPGTDGIKIAVFGDLHGHLRLMLQLCRLWQVHHECRLDAVLLCGDLGYFPNPDLVDRATRRFANRDPEELGFFRFFSLPNPPEPDALVERTLTGDPDSLQTVCCPILWCEGNHEDFFSLQQEVGNLPLKAVDAYGRFVYLASGRLFTLGAGSVWEEESAAGRRSDTLRLAAVGGGPESEAGWDEDLPIDPLGVVGSRAVHRLESQSVDLLVTHCGPRHESRGLGHASERLRSLVDIAQPRFHFFAHHRGPIAPFEIGRTTCVWLSDVNFERSADGSYCHVSPGCMGILTWNQSDPEFEPVADKWFQKVTWSNWQGL